MLNSTTAVANARTLRKDATDSFERKARAFRFANHGLGLDEACTSSPETLLARIAYAPVPGGATPYLALGARTGSLSRAPLDDAAFGRQVVRLVPFARGTLALVPDGDVAWALQAAAQGHRSRASALERSGLVDRRTLGRLRDTIVRLLECEPLGSDELRARLPDSLAVSLGAQGRKLGFPTLFGLAIRELQLEGHVFQEPKERRFDRSAFAWRYAPTPLDTECDRMEALEALAGRYFRANGPATALSFAYWADASISEARAAVSRARLSPVANASETEPLWVGAEQHAAFTQYAPADAPSYALVPFRDPLVDAFKDSNTLFAAADRNVLLGNGAGRLVPGGGRTPHHHFILDRGQVIGTWTFEPQSGVELSPFNPLPRAGKERLRALGEQLSRAIVGELGDACLYDRDKDARLHSTCVRS